VGSVMRAGQRDAGSSGSRVGTPGRRTIAGAALALVLLAALMPGVGSAAGPGPLASGWAVLGGSDSAAPSESPPSSESPVPSMPGGFPRCSDVHRLEADPSIYRDAPIYVANEQPTGQVLAWARTQPGFEELWIDREHLGWISVGFSQGADARQADIERLFPNDGVVAVAVPHTKRELRRLQRQVGASLSEATSDWMTSASVSEGLVEVGVAALTDEVVAFLEQHFADQPLCVDGADPATIPSPGPQPRAGDGWRLLGADRVGKTYRTGIAWDEASLARLWQQSGLPGRPPAVDFRRDVAIWFAHVYGSSCPNQRLDDVLVDEQQALVYPLIVDPDAPIGCTDDANPFAFVVAVGRQKLPTAPFSIQLGPQAPPVGAPRERTVVEADLSKPGAVAEPGEVHADRTHRRENVLQSGAVVEPGFAQPYRFDVGCGIDWLGVVNDIQWRLDPRDHEHAGGGKGESPVSTGSIESPGNAELPPAWGPLVSADGTLEVSLLLLTDPEPRVEVTAEGVTLGYIPSLEAPPACSPG
jgi:hypothetical protein